MKWDSFLCVIRIRNECNLILIHICGCEENILVPWQLGFVLQMRSGLRSHKTGLVEWGCKLICTMIKSIRTKPFVGKCEGKVKVVRSVKRACC